MSERKPPAAKAAEIAAPLEIASHGELVVYPTEDGSALLAEGGPLLRTAGSMSHERMQQIAHERYALFDAKRRQAEVLAADAEDIKELKPIKKACNRRGGKDAS